ncbi:10700_t:CDS:2 [Acaulospora morrowiae]|uniref:10700_t:CDS:1 n=1 Tax=Acaulospora morrowiae TaxID=94023 RepID=A0A9N8YYF9_9GLOM|nr:10700_t:CDS:2 [Acaulospora morrowiae]
MFKGEPGEKVKVWLCQTKNVLYAQGIMEERAMHSLLLYQVNLHIDWRTNMHSLNDGPCNIKVSASIFQTPKKPECYSFLISRHQLARTPTDEEIFAVCATFEEAIPEKSSLSSEEAAILKEFVDIFSAKLLN